MASTFHYTALYLAAVILLIASTHVTLAAPVPEPLWKWRTPERIGQWPWKIRAGLAGIAVIAFLNLGVAGLAKITFWAQLRPLYLCACVAAVAMIASRHIPGRPLRIAVILTAAGIAVAWYEYPSWLTIDAVACVLTLYLVLFLQPLVTFRVLAVVALIIAVGYDLVTLYYLGDMLRFATGIESASIPGLIVVPTHLGLSSTYADAIGCGDVIFPAFVVVAAGRMAQRGRCWQVYAWAVGGYAVGLGAAVLVLTLTSAPQPATIFTIPGVVAASVYAVYRYGIATQLSVKITAGDHSPP